MIRRECCINIFRLLIGNQIDLIYKHIGTNPTKVAIDCSTVLYYPRGRFITSIDEALDKSVVLHDNIKNETLYIYDPERGSGEKCIVLLQNLSNIILNPYIHGLLMVSFLFVLYRMIQWSRSLFNVIYSRIQP